MIPLCEKYRCECFLDIKGQDNTISSLKSFFRNFPYKKAVIIHGPPGTGKTSLAYAIAQENNLELFELNASDLRNRQKLEEVMKPATEQSSLSKKGKVILVDEVEGITSGETGGLLELLALIEKTAFPIIITANNIWQQKFSMLRKKAEMIKISEVKYETLFLILKEISLKEKKEIDENVLKTIAAKSRGDIRAALNDLQTILELGKISPYSLDEREKEEDIFNVLRKVFKDRANPKMLEVYENLDMPLDEVFLWIEENIPYEYKGEELARAYEALSKADVFRGRVYRQQHWRFLLYQNFFLSAGVSFASRKMRSLRDFTIYQRPKRILKIWLYNQKNESKKSIAEKYSKYCHISKKRALKEFPFLKMLIKSNPKIMRELRLSEKEEEFLAEKPLVK